LERRAQPRSRLAGTARARQTASYPGHALTAASPALRLMDGTIGRAIDDETWSWTGPWMTHAENTASPCIRSGTKARYPNPSCTG